MLINNIIMAELGTYILIASITMPIVSNMIQSGFQWLMKIRHCKTCGGGEITFNDNPTPTKPNNNNQSFIKHNQTADLKAQIEQNEKSMSVILEHIKTEKHLDLNNLKNNIPQ